MVKISRVAPFVFLAAGALGGALGCVSRPPAEAPHHEHPHPSDDGAAPKADENVPSSTCPCRQKKMGAEPTAGSVVSHAALRTFENNGNALVGIATASQGAESFEVWRSSVAVGSKTPFHTHETEEVFVVLRGRGVARIGDRELAFEAPATVIAPAGVPHQIENTGTEPTDSIVVVGVGSRIFAPSGDEMQLPWRH